MLSLSAQISKYSSFTLKKNFLAYVAILSRRNKCEGESPRAKAGGLSPLTFFFIFLFLIYLFYLTPCISIASAAAVTIAWDKNAETDVIGYKLHYGIFSRFSQNYQYTVDVNNNTSCSISGLAEGTKYYFAVTAYNDKNLESSYSEELAHTIPITPPPVNDPPSPDPMTWATAPHAGGTSSVSMTATTASDPSGVEYYFEETSGNPGGTDSGWQNSVNYTDSGLNAGTVYSYRVKARDKSADQKETSWSSTSTATTDPDPPPPPPVDTDGDGLYDDDENNIYGTDPNKADSDGDGMNDGDELAFWGNNWSDDPDNDGLVNLIDPDSDDDDFSDGFEVAEGYDPADPSSHPIPDALAFEIGTIQLDHNWMQVDFKESFVDPIVISNPISINGSHPAVIRIRNIHSDGCDIRIQEWDYLDGSHTNETVSYLVMEKGNFTLDDGTQIEAGRFETNKTGSFGKFNFSQSFQETPVVLASISSFNEADAVTGRLRNISNQEFEFCMQEQEFNPKEHLTETIDYIAWQSSKGRLNGYKFEVSKTADKVKNSFYSIEFEQSFGNAPHFLADMQTADGKNTANVRWQNKNNHSVEVQIDEEQSNDTETRHGTEVVGYMVFE